MRAARLIGFVFAGLGLLYGVLCLTLFSAMRQTPERFGAIMSKVPDVAFLIFPLESFWMVARAGHLKVGDAAPDFELPTVDHTRRVKLSSQYRSRPVVLIFGSYT
jgi:hypothetical protein